MSDRREYTSRVEMRNGLIYVTRQIEGLKAPYTKWDFLSESERETYSNQTFGSGFMKCSGCGEKIVTEADFAKHFIIPDVRYFNLGNCPNKEKDND